MATPPPSAEGHGPVSWNALELERIDAIAARYPTRRSATLPVLWMAQEKWGWLSHDVMRCVAATLQLPPSEVASVASFYTMFKKQPTGKYLIQICQTLPCALRGARKMIRLIEEKLEIGPDGHSADGMFTLMKVECLASCGSAPMMQVNEDFYELLTPDKVDEIFERMRAGHPLPTPRPEADQWTWKHES